MELILDNLPIVFLLVAGVCAPLSGWFATTRSRQPAVWFVLGALIGPLALVLLALAPPGRCPACDTPVRGWAGTCERCGFGFRSRRVPAAAGPLPERASVSDHDDVGRSGAPRVPLSRRPAAPLIASAATSMAPAHAWAPGHVRHTANGPRIVARPREDPDHGVDAPGEQVLSTAIYLSGNAGLEIGATYAIARAGSRLRIVGPVDAGQLTVRHEGELASFEVTAVDDRVIISGGSGRMSLAIVFRLVGGMRALDLEGALANSTVGLGTLP